MKRQPTQFEATAAITNPHGRQPVQPTSGNTKLNANNEPTGTQAPAVHNLQQRKPA